MKPFLEKLLIPESSGKINCSIEPEDNFYRHIELKCKDLCINTYMYQMKGYPAGFSFLRAHLGININSLIPQFNSIKPIFRSILNEKVPGIADLLYAANKPAAEEGVAFFKKIDDEKCDVEVPFYLENSSASITLLNNSIYLTGAILEMLIAIKTEELNFIDLSSICCNYSNLNDVNFLIYAYNTLPLQGVMDEQ